MPNPELSKEAVKELINNELITLLDRLFKTENLKGLDDKCNYLLEISKNGLHKPLEPAMLKRLVFRPLKTTGKLKLSSGYADRMANTLWNNRELLHLSKAEEELLDKLRMAYDVVIDKEPVPKKSISKFKDISAALYSINKGLNSFVGREFLTYERIGHERKKSAEWGIGIGQLKFTRAKDYIRAEMSYLAPDNVPRNCFGTASHDEKYDYLFIDLLMEGEKPKRANLVLRLTNLGARDNTVLLGYLTYHSNFWGRLITKSFVIQAVNSEVELKEPGNYNFDTEEYKKIPLEIRSYLYDRSKNRLSQPREEIGSLYDLKLFLQTHKIEKEDRLFTKKHFEGDFDIYFKQAAGKIAHAQIKISLNELSGHAEGEFVYAPTRNGKFLKKWVGQVYNHSENRVVVMELSNEKDIKNRKKEEPEDPILIFFNVPQQDEISDAECFQGLICGLGDVIHGSVAYRCLIVRTAVNQPTVARLAEIFQNEVPLAIGASNDLKFSVSDFEFA